MNLAELLLKAESASNKILLDCKPLITEIPGIEATRQEIKKLSTRCYEYGVKRGWTPITFARVLTFALAAELAANEALLTHEESQL